jgi:hypothetical protein
VQAARANRERILAEGRLVKEYGGLQAQMCVELRLFDALGERASIDA